MVSTPGGIRWGSEGTPDDRRHAESRLRTHSAGSWVRRRPDSGEATQQLLLTIQAGKEYEELMGPSLILCLVLSALLGSVSTPELGPETGMQSSSDKSPVGRWKTVDDATGKVKSVVTIWEEAGKLYGRIQKLVDPDPQDPNPR